MSDHRSSDDTFEEELTDRKRGGVAQDASRGRGGIDDEPATLEQKILAPPRRAPSHHPGRPSGGDFPDEPTQLSPHHPTGQSRHAGHGRGSSDFSRGFSTPQGSDFSNRTPGSRQQPSRPGAPPRSGTPPRSDSPPRPGAPPRAMSTPVPGPAQPPSTGGKGAKASNVEDQLRKFQSLTGELNALPRDSVGLGGSGASSASSPATAETSVRTIALSAVVIALVASLIVGYLAVSRWMTTQEVTLWAVLGVLIPTLGLGLILAWPDRSSRPSKASLLALAPATAVALATVFIGLSWEHPMVRALALRMAPQTPQVWVEMLRSSSPTLATKACQALAQRTGGSPEIRQALLGALTVRPQLAPQCLQQVADEATRVDLAGSLAERWHRQLLLAESEATCELAPAMAALPLEEGERNARLLSCAVDSEGEGTQTCCSAALETSLADTGEKSVVAWLEQIENYLQPFQLVSSVTAMSLRGKELDGSLRSTAEALKLSQPGVQRKVLAIACESLEQGGDELIVRQLAATSEPGCPLNAQQIPRERSAWLQICADSAVILADEPDTPVNEALCRAAEDSFAATAVAIAQKFLHYSVRSNTRSALSSQIDRGYARESDLTPDDIAQRFQESLPELTRGDLTPTQMQQLSERLQLRQQKQMAERAEIPSIHDAPSLSDIPKMDGFQPEQWLSEEGVKRLKEVERQTRRRRVPVDR